VNGSRIIWRILVWLVGILSVVLVPAVYAMMIQIVLAHWFTIAIFAAVVIGFPLAAHLESKH
jgi:hypothetical protein